MPFNLKYVKDEVDRALAEYLPGEDLYPQQIHRAVRYSVFAGGKRLRPLLTLAAAEIFGVPRESAMPAACALELVHTYSLIHDDLPAMDDDDFRRGRLTSHKVFGEAMAILAGDALLTLAFETLVEEAPRYFPAGIVVSLAKELGKAAGIRGMIGGQVVDILSEGRQVDADTLKYMHRHKTGALFTCSIRSGAIMGNATEEELASLTRFAENAGLAFQIVDDLLDIVGDEAKLGKKVGSDIHKNKATYPALFGLEESRRQADAYLGQALTDLASFGERAENLLNLARLLVHRDK